MKKFNQTFSSVKDLIGNKKETLTEFPDYIYKTKSLEDLKGYTRTLNLKLTKHSKTNQLLIEENKQLSEQILLYSNLFINNEESSLNVCEPLSNVFKIVGEMINEIENYRQTFEQSISQKWLQQLNEYGKSDCKDGQLAKNRFDKARLSFDEASEQFKQLRKKQNNINNEKLLEAEEDLDYATQQFSDIASESLQTMDDIIVKHNLDSFESASSTIQSYKDFFQKGLDHCLSVQSDLEIQKHAMSKYKQQLLEKKKLRSTVVQFEQTNSSRTISLPPPPPPKPTSSTPSSSPSPSPSSSIINIHNNYIAMPKGNTKVFGMALSTITEREKSDIPMIIDKSIQFLLLEENITQEGIFRVSPNQKQLTDLKNNVNAGYITTLDGIDDAHLISSFVKAFLREMPIPLFTFDLYHSLVDCVINEEKYDCDKIKISNAIVLVLQKLPKPNFLLAKSLISLLWKISTKSSQNKMTTSNLAVTVAPNVLYPKLLDIRSLTNANATIEFIISNFNNIFNNQLISNLYNNSCGVSGGSSGGGGGGGSSGGVANPRHSVLPPSLPARPQSVMFKNTPLSVNTSSSQSSSSSSSSSFASSASPPPTPTKPPSSSSSPIITTTSPNSNTNINSNTSVNTNINPRHSVLPPSLPPKKISSSSNSLPSPPPPSSPSIPEKSQNNITPTILSSSLSAPTSPTTTTTTNPLRSSTGSPKPISNRVSMYLQNSNTGVPLPSQKPQRVISNNNTTTNSRPLSNSLDLPPPLAPVGMPLETLEPIQRNLTSNEAITISEVNWN
ncbi:RhoGAP domain-containing protein [Dictyostelium discoideum AX4]|uniref:Rho GTPase-activating protein gacR n=1 Tax=Dictyostelium discoideum TaxID=44689 RepID=GACR_DICDI|nr:RhoGAP domain-containing protein [Dictyostelium discoideum AX4]Q54XT6.1 RecName: Full=Rho GTPase-activating protein gacR; AltName: Full=GTPase activating factor for raC protein R [Dictyostelium discoideum]EAL67979.1 RhoGAP domain-containing protein [Dictyostelium discoideum AX4]|eukprot:XP_641917.1 RhoGAP domain-containing protein [Dictyostelium discoideum AX4]